MSCDRRAPLAGAVLVLAFFIVLPVPVHAAATITIVNTDGSGEGFNDPTPWSPTGGNPATTLGQARLNAFQHAANIWAGRLTSSVTIRVAARMDPLTCGPSFAVLGSAGTLTLHRDFNNAPLSGTWYPQALANALAGADLSPGNADITATFNSSINGDPDCIGGASWYYGYDADPPAGDYDFVTVVLHELGHGLGFQPFFDLQDGSLNGGYDDAYMVHLNRAGAVPPDYPSMNDAQRVAANISDPELRWTGGHVTYMVPGAGVTDGLNANYIRMYAPDPLRLGSSVAHFSVDVWPDEIMEPSFTVPMHDPGLALHLLHDIGWTLDPSVPVLFEQLSATPIDASVEVRWRYWADEAVSGFRVYRQEIDGGEEDLASADLLPVQTEGFLDTRVRPGTSYRYSVAAVAPDGAETRSPAVTVSVSRFATELAPNVPNPFNPATELRYKLGRDGHVTLRVYDLAGRLVRTLVDERQAAGSHGVFWNGRDAAGRVAPAGVYVGRLETETVVRSRRMLLLK
jgi:hypothetical protein